MAKKTCPKCNKQHGTRKKVCECGYDFNGKHPLSPEPGAWVADEIKGFPKIYRPDELPRTGKISTKKLRDELVAYEGLGFCLYSYVPTSKIEDAALRILWRKARKAMQDVVEYMENEE